MNKIIIITMEDLVDNFSKHISKMLSKRLGSQIENIISRNPLRNNEENYTEIETSIKSAIESFFYRASDKDYQDIATNIYNSFVEKDDQNIINAIKNIIRTYSYYEEMNLRKKLYQWKINSSKKNNYNNNSNFIISYQNNIETSKKKSSSLSKKKKFSSFENKDNIENESKNNKTNRKDINNYRTLNNSGNNDIFERLYNDGMRKKNQQRTLEEINDINKLNSRYT